MWSCRHVGNIQGKMEDAKNTLCMASRYIQALDEEADRLANMRISDDEIQDFLDELLPVN